MNSNRPSKVGCVPRELFKMACLENVPPEHGDSEMEEGEIVDELDELSDISSEEEFLMRQRLQVLENYNNVLERKKTKANHSSARSGNKRHNHNLAETSRLDLNDFARFTPQQNILVLGDALKKFKSVLDVGYSNATPHQNIKVYQTTKDPRPYKPHAKRKINPEPPSLPKTRENKKKTYRKKRSEVFIISETESEESEDEYRNKRRKLADAVALNKEKSDTSSLQARLKKMLNKTSDSESIQTINQQIAIEHTILVKDSSSSPITPKCSIINSENEEILSIASSEVQFTSLEDEKENERIKSDPIECADDDDIVINVDMNINAKGEIKFDINKDNLDTLNFDINKDNLDLDTVNCNAKEITEEKPAEVKLDEGKNSEAQENKNDEGKNSDDDLELLRQHALKTKSSKTFKSLQDTSTGIQKETPTEIQKPQSEDEDSDTAELRLICLKSALLKKAIEMKQKQKLKKRLSQSIAQDNFVLNDELYEIIESDNNTDIEAMDMDIGSDGDEKTKENVHHKEHTENKIAKDVINTENQIAKDVTNTENKIAKDLTNEPRETGDVNQYMDKEEELDEDEDLLRARLLTSLSKNLPNLVDPTIFDALEESPEKKKSEQIEPKATKPIINKPAKKIIINVGESDSEGEHEATKNLTKMHIKLSEQKDFQQKLDMFLKSARSEVEQEKLPDVVQKPPTPQKFVAKAVDHLPKSEQIEYKNLVKRMAELEKIKQARQVSVTITNNGPMNDTLRQPNLLNDSNIVNNVEEQITLSRKKIAEESARMLKLREEATKLSQKYKIVQTELRNISTAITLNKREQRSVQGKLAKIRMQHQRLLNSSTSKHAKLNNRILNMPSNKTTINKTQLENARNNEYKDREAQESLKIIVVNDLNEQRLNYCNEQRLAETSLSVEVDVTSNRKTITAGPAIESTEFENRNISNTGREDDKNKGDYESPLQALGGGNWGEDPNAILCPFEVGGRCKDVACKYLHPKLPTH